MNLNQAISLYAADNREPEQADNSSLSGKRFRVVDQGYGHVVSEHDTYADAFKAMMAKPYTKIVTGPFPDQAKRDAAFRKSQESNPDVDAEGAAPVSPQTSLFPRDDETESQQLRDTVRRRQVKTNPDVDARRRK